MTERTNELLSEAAREIIQELGPLSADANLRAAQQNEFDKRYAAAKRAAREQAQREQKRSELQRYVDRRGREWVELTGSTLGLEEQQARWKQEYADEQERKRASRRQAAIDEAYDF